MYKSYDLIKKLEPKIGEEEAKELIVQQSRNQKEFNHEGPEAAGNL